MTTTDDRLVTTIPTPAGEVGILFHGTGVVAYAGRGGDPVETPITINGVQYGLRVNLTPRAHWERRTENWKNANPAYLSPNWVVLWEDLTHSLHRDGGTWSVYGGATDAASKYLREKLLPVISAYLESDAGMLIEEGEKRERRQLRSSVREHRQQARKFAEIFEVLEGLILEEAYDGKLDLLWDLYREVREMAHKSTWYDSGQEKMLAKLIEHSDPKYRGGK